MLSDCFPLRFKPTANAGVSSQKIRNKTMIKKLALALIISFFSISVFATQLNIKINHKVVDGKVFISGVTNLPEGTKIGVGVSSKNGYSAQSYNLFVKSGGGFHSESFSDKGNKLHQ
jgi:hypothetical protein